MSQHRASHPDPTPSSPQATITVLRLLTTKDAKDDSGTLTDAPMQLSANTQAKIKVRSCVLGALCSSVRAGCVAEWMMEDAVTRRHSVRKGSFDMMVIRDTLAGVPGLGWRAHTPSHTITWGALMQHAGAGGAGAGHQRRDRLSRYSGGLRRALLHACARVKCVCTTAFVRMHGPRGATAQAHASCCIGCVVLVPCNARNEVFCEALTCPARPWSSRTLTVHRGLKHVNALPRPSL